MPTPDGRRRPTGTEDVDAGGVPALRRRRVAPGRRSHRVRATLGAAVLTAATCAGLVASAGPGTAAGSLTVGSGYGAYAPAADWPSPGAPLATTFGMAGLVSGGDGTIGSVQVTGQPASGSATASGSAVVYTPATGTSGSQVVGVTVCDTSSPAACGSSTVTFDPPVHITVQFNCPSPLTGSITQVVGMAEEAPASVLQGATFTSAQAAEPSHPPASFSCSGTTATVQQIDTIDAIVPVPAGASYVSGTASLSGGDPTTDAHTALLYCDGSSTPAAVVPSTASGTCSAQSGTTNYPSGLSSSSWQTTTPYFELVTALPSGSGYTPSSTVDEPTVTASFTATGAAGSRINPALTEFDTYGSAQAYGYTQSAWLYGAPQTVTPIGTTAIGAVPTVASVAPASGTTSGGTSVTVTGSGFTGATAVSFGATAAASFTVGSDTSLTAVSPAGAAGTVDVTITTAQGTSPTGSGDRFTYQAGPQVTGISPSSGPGGGGTVVTVTGTGFTGATAVSFGQAPAATFTVQSATTLSATSPPAATGTVDITVTTPAGTSPATAADRYTTTSPPPAPTVTGLQPSTGSAAGGTGVTVSGSSFTAGSTVAFGGVAAASVTVDGPTTITAVSPAAAPGTADVTVTTAGGTSATSAADVFTYVQAAPQPIAGPPAPPGPPSVTGLTAGPDQLTVAFAPGSPGADPVTSYQATCTPAHGTAGTATEAAPGAPGDTSPSPLTVTGLQPGVTYSCSVTATSSAGTGTASAPATGTPEAPATGPAAPTGIAAQAADGGATLHWAPSATPGVIAYLVAVSPPCPGCTGVLVPGGGAGTAVVGLPNDARADLRVAAVGASGTIGPLSVAVSVEPQASAGCPGTARGVWIAHWDGTVTTTGSGVPAYGSMAGRHPAAAIAGIVPAPGCTGYWEFGTDGGVFAFGSARFLGAGHASPADPVVAMAATPDGRGYWLVTASGAVRAFGNAVLWGRTTPPVAPGDRVVAAAATPDGRGLRLVTASGTDVAYGDAAPYGPDPAGDAGGVVAMAVTPDGWGAWLLTAAGTVLAAGDAPPVRGPGRPPASGGPWTALAADPAGGLWAVDAAGTVVPLDGAPALPAGRPADPRTPAWAATPH